MLIFCFVFAMDTGFGEEVKRQVTATCFHRGFYELVCDVSWLFVFIWLACRRQVIVR